MGILLKINTLFRKLEEYIICFQYHYHGYHVGGQCLVQKYI